MLPRLAAQEQLEAVSATALGSGILKKHDVRRAIGKLEAAAQGGRSKPVKTSLDTLKAIGIKVTVVPPDTGGANE